MWTKFKRLFIIKNRIEASFIVYALGLGAAQRGQVYLETYPPGWAEALYVACLLAVLMAGAKIFDAIRLAREIEELRKSAQ